MMSFLTTAWQYRRYILVGLTALAFLTLYAGYSFRGYEIDRLNSQAALVEQAAKFRADTYAASVTQLVEARKRAENTKQYIIRSIPNDKTTLPDTILNAYASLCAAGANCERAK